MILALSDDPRSTTSWASGARGEQTIGKSLDRLRAEGFAVLQDRRIPGSKANIDHLVISPAGVFVIDTKNYKGKVERRDVGSSKSDARLFVGGRDRTKLVEGMQRQLDAVRSVLAQDTEYLGIPIVPVVLFMSADNWGLLDRRPLQFGAVYVLWGKALGKLVRAEGPLSQSLIERAEQLLAVALPAA